jgi:hypothetical protein
MDFQRLGVPFGAARKPVINEANVAPYPQLETILLFRPLLSG